jgi:hypothetical protein
MRQFCFRPGFSAHQSLPSSSAETVGSLSQLWQMANWQREQRLNPHCSISAPQQTGQMAFWSSEFGLLVEVTLVMNGDIMLPFGQQW